jgi:Arc/MetJ-type ribon-helix-helix transcriptional regulator
MVKMISFQVEDVLAKDIERILSLGVFSSKSEFIKDAIRKSIEKQKETDKWRNDFDKSIKKIRENALAKGWNGKLPTREERAKIADEWLEERGMKFNLTTNQLEKIQK